MNYEQFIDWRRNELDLNPALFDAGETNIYRSFSRHPELPEIEPCSANLQVYRCDLAREISRKYGFPQERIAISRGVRDSLSVLFPIAAQLKVTIWIPADVYPTYWSLASTASEDIVTKPFLIGPNPLWPESAPCGAAEWLLLPNPIKPWGRQLSTVDVDILRSWVTASPQRRILIDGVYAPDTVPDSTLSLLATGQVLLLMSLSKGWLLPRKLGWVVLPEIDAESMKPCFANREKDLPSLRIAWNAMFRFPERPTVVKRLVDAQRKILISELANQKLYKVSDPNEGYFVPSSNSTAKWRAAGVIAIPASIFGSNCSASFLSALTPEHRS